MSNNLSKTPASSFPKTTKNSIRATADLVVSKVRLFPGSFRLFGIPGGIKSCKSFDCKPIYPRTLIQRELPKTIHKTVHWKFTRELKEDERNFFPEVYVLDLEGGISSNIGANLTKDGMLIPEVSKQFDLRKNEEHKIFKTPSFLPKVEHYNNSVATVAFDGQYNYFHWIFDALPQFHLLEQVGAEPEKLYVEYKSKFQKETLGILGYSSEKIINSQNLDFISASHLIVPSFPGKSGIVQPWACDFLRKKFIELSLHQGELDLSDGKYKRVYLSRSGASRRRILNEAELWQLLEGYGFTKIQGENLSFLDQVKVFNNAEIVVAPHGAGLSNLVFCKEGTKVIEIFSPNYVNSCFWNVSEQSGLDYYYQIGEGEHPPEYYDMGRVTDNIEVDLDKLKETFELAAIS